MIAGNLWAKQLEQLLIVLGKDAAFAPEEGDVVALLHVLQMQRPQTSLGQILGNCAPIKKSNAAAHQQQLLQNMHISHFQQPPKIR